MAQASEVQASQQQTFDVNGEWVLYWMSTAMRCDENPALDVASTLARELDLPLLVYQGLSQRYDYASDRLHTFILQGVQDVQQEMRRRGIAYVFHLERPGHESDHLRQLVQRSAATVTEDMPTHAPRKFLKALLRKTSQPIIAVDTACVVAPMLVGKSYDRAFAYRNKTRKLYQARLTRPWPSVNYAANRTVDTSQLDIESTVVADAEISEWVAQCEIDHCIAPVSDTQGGTVAGYERWEEFKQNGLRHYAKRRNNALVDGVSRMSAYLHFGMVSPMRIAREAANFDHDGAEKYLDELLIWRELAYCFCHFREDHDQWTALPEWAQATLEDHRSDDRKHVYTWEQLARAQTNDTFWNAAQKSLLMQGELHNNVRMTWGKAILNWTRDPKRALQWIVDLNHRYALDGRDPASYGGILWCLGQFDRPFSPEQPIFGTVRTRPTAIHAQRLDPQEYSQHTSTPRFHPVPRVAVIGAGLSGCIAARTLSDHGLPVQVFEKSRGVSGRMSTRRTDAGSFDHGAQYFTARDERFRRYVDAWIDQGTVAQWHGEVVAFDCAGEPTETSTQQRFCGVPGMNSIGKHIAADLDVKTETRIQGIHRTGDRYLLIDDEGEQRGEFDRVVVAIPPAQAAEILADFTALETKLKQVQMNPCWATLCRLSKPLPVNWVGAFVNLEKNPLRWIGRNQTKPGRDESIEHLVLHAEPAWSRENIESEPETVATSMLTVFWEVTGLEPLKPEILFAHRWRYSIPDQPIDHRCLASEDHTLVACGDWAGGPRVEGAFLSGCAAAGRIFGTLPQSDAAAEQLELF